MKVLYEDEEWLV